MPLFHPCSTLPLLPGNVLTLISTDEGLPLEPSPPMALASTQLQRALWHVCDYILYVIVLLATVSIRLDYYSTPSWLLWVYLDLHQQFSSHKSEAIGHVRAKTDTDTGPLILVLFPSSACPSKTQFTTPFYPVPFSTTGLPSLVGLVESLWHLLPFAVADPKWQWVVCYVYRHMAIYTAELS